MPIYRGFSQAGQGTVAGIVYGIPPLGTDAQVVVKQGTASGETEWKDLSITLSGLIQGVATMDSEGGVAISTSEDTFPYEPDLSDPASDGYILSSTTAGVRSWVELITSYESSLGNPAVDGYMLSSTAAGVRSWVVAASGGIPNGGTVDQILVKQSATDGDALWEDNIISGSNIYIGAVDPISLSKASDGQLDITPGDTATYCTVGLTTYNGTNLGYLSANSAGQIGLQDEGSHWAIRHTEDVSTEFFSHNQTLRATINSNGIHLTGGLTTNAGDVILRNLPTADPLVADQVWNDVGTLKISAG